MSQPLRVLIVEDSESDAELLRLELRRAGYEAAWQLVHTRESMVAALADGHWDVIISDYVMPQFDGLEALRLVKAAGLDLPFIIVSGHITDATAVAAMKAGAHDYVMKDNLARLGPAVERELREAATRQERRRAEERVKAEHRITRILTDAQGLSDAGPAILGVLVPSLKVDFGALWVPDPRHGLLSVAFTQPASGIPAFQAFLNASRRLTVPPGSSLAGRVWKERMPLWVEGLSIEISPARRQAAAQAGLRSAMAFPIHSAAEVFGVFEFLAARPLNPDPPLVNMMTAVGHEIGQFLHRRNAETALRRAHDELELRVQQRTAELQAANAKLQAAMAERQRLENELLEITDQERRRIGLDLHDDLGQKLSGIALMTKGLQLKLAKGHLAEARDAARIHALVQSTMNHASDLAHQMAALDLGKTDLPTALRKLAAHARKVFGITCRFTSPNTPLPLETTVVTQLYKIAQEAVTNAIKHGKARKVGLGLSHDSGRLTLRVQNSGLPFPALRSRSTGMGLRIMNYRASLIGAALEVKAAGPRGGTVVTCSLPLAARV